MRHWPILAALAMLIVLRIAGVTLIPWWLVLAPVWIFPAAVGAGWALLVLITVVLSPLGVWK